jgi:ribonuclease-3
VDIQEFSKRIGASFNDPALIIEAFTHRSFVNENRSGGARHNERLEFLGDAVLELIVTDYLYHKYPHANEGELTSFRAALVNTDSLSNTARHLGMNDLLRLSKGESRDLGRARHYILANVFESVVGALFLDKGIEAARDFIVRFLLPQTDDIVVKGLWRDAKSTFQEKAQEYESVTPTYKVLEESGPDHDKKFTIGVYLNDELIAEGEGHAKQEAEQDAAHLALKKKNWLSAGDAL